mgnify:FL=1
MKKILIISSSARKSGKTAALYSRFARGAQENGNVVERQFLIEKHIESCSGCGRCLATKRCLKSDDTRRILDRMIWADAIVLAMPVEFYSLDVQIQRLLDRVQPRREELAKKEYYFVLTSRFVEKKELEKVLEMLRSKVREKIPGAVEAGFLLETGRKEENENNEDSEPAVFEAAYRLGCSV